MTSLAGRMSEVDALIFGVIGETAVISGNNVKGILNKKYREIETRDGSIVGLDLSFDCQHQDFMDALTPGASLTVEGVEYKFRRQVPPGGDESGLVILELARA